MTRRDFVLSSAAAAALPLVADSYVDTGRRLTQGWEHYRGQLGGIWEVWRGEKASDNVAWHPVEVPHCFNSRDAVDPDEAYYQGPGWYRTYVDIDTIRSIKGHRTLLHFEGAGQKTEVYVGQKLVGRHVGGYDEWSVDITEAAGALTKVPIAIFCDNSRDLEMIPSSLSDFNLYGGLYRYVNLRHVPPVSIERVHVEQGVVRARLYNPSGLKDSVTLSIVIRDPENKSIHTESRTVKPWAGEQEIARFKIDAPMLWSPEKPSLYKCIVAFGNDSTLERFGIRTVEWVEHGPFKLNGERLLLKGTSRHEDHAGLAAAMTEDLIRKEMLMIKDMGANFIRLGHYQQARIVLDLCDELGLLVWEEIPWCRGGVGGDRYREQARGMMRAMIDQHRNHPSVILWGLGNENDWPGDFDQPEPAMHEKIRAFMTELNALAHSLDPSRQTVIRRCDFAKDIPDVYSPSIWAGWYGGRYTDYKSSSEKEMKQVRHFIHAEWGGDSHAGRHAENPDKMISQIAAGGRTDERGLDYLLTGGQTRASKDGDWSETYICNLFDWHLKEQEMMPWLTGAAQWIFKDFSTPLRPENPVPRMNQKGLVERDLTPKESYYVFQSYWAEKPMARIYGHSWPMRWGNEGESKMVKVYSNCSTAELFVNGVSCGVKTRNSQDFPAAGLRWMVPFEEGNNRIRVVARKGAAELTDQITTFYQTRKFGKPTHFELSQSKVEGGMTQVEAWLMDTGGIMCVEARNAVRFELAGDGLLIDNLGTARGSRKVELCNGRAYINVNPRNGKSVVSISSPGLPTAFINIG